MAPENVIKKLGRFEIYERIGEGGFGTVYRGYDPKWEKPVAIKILHKDVARLPNAVERFRKEAKVAADLRHPNIVGVIEVGEFEADYFLVMDFISGGTLAQKMQEIKFFALSQVVEYLSPIADALDYAHSHKKKIIHRDIKPSNILIGEDGQIYLSDFGLTKLTEDTSTTTTGMVLGTYEYMAPEQITGKDLTPAVDLYALGVVAYQMLTGRPPFTSPTNSPFEVQEKHVHHAPPDPRSLRPEIPEEVCQVLFRVLAKDPAQRYATGKEFIADLQSAVEHFTQIKVEQLHQQARQSTRIYDFSAAIKALEEIETISPSTEIQEQILDYRQKEQQLADLKQKTEELQNGREQLAALKASLPWYQPDTPQDSPVKPTVPPIVRPALSIVWLEWIAITVAVLFFQVSNAWQEFPGTFWYPAGMIVIFAAFASTYFQSNWIITSLVLAVGAGLSIFGWPSYAAHYVAINFSYTGAAFQPIFFAIAIGVTLFRVWRIRKER